MTVRMNDYGAWIVSDIIDGHLVTRQYQGYSQSEAEQSFKDETGGNVENLENLSISEIAQIIRKDWKNVYFGAVPYLDVMLSLNSIADNYGLDNGKSIVLYFLSNANAYRGEMAKAVKTELKRRLKAK